MLNTKENVETLNSASRARTVKVLLVSEKYEDCVLIKDLIAQSHYGNIYVLEWYDNYAKAINAMLKRHFDLYLVDYKIGNYTGLDLLHEAVCSNCTEPIIMLSENSDIKADEEALRIGATDYLIKGSMDGHTLERSMRYSLEHNIALKNLKGNENKFRTIFEKSIYPIIITDYAGGLYDANPAAVKFFELSLEKLLNENANNFYSKEDRERFVQAMEERGAVSDLELNMHLPNGRTKFCSISSFVQISQHGNTVYYHSIIHDLTSRKEQESLAAEKIALSEQLAKSLAYEIQNPLTNVNLALNELSTNISAEKSESLKVYLDIVKENFERIDKLTKSLSQTIDQSAAPNAGLNGNSALT